MEKKNKIKEFVKEHRGTIGYLTGAAVTLIGVAIGNKIVSGRIAKNNVPVNITTEYTMGDLGKLGEALVEQIDELTADTKVLYWRVFWKNPNKE